MPVDQDLDDADRRRQDRAATFPILTRMATEGWAGLSVFYRGPLKALLNNLLPRPGYAAAYLA